MGGSNTNDGMSNTNTHVHYTRFNLHSISDGPGFKIIVHTGSDSTGRWTPLHTHTHTHTHAHIHIHTHTHTHTHTYTHTHTHTHTPHLKQF